MTSKILTCSANLFNRLGIRICLLCAWSNLNAVLNLKKNSFKDATISSQDSVDIETFFDLAKLLQVPYDTEDVLPDTINNAIDITSDLRQRSDGDDGICHSG